MQKTNPNKTYQIWLPLILSIMVILGMAIGMKVVENDMYFIRVVQNEKKAPTALKPSVDEIIRYVEEQYVDSIDGDELRQTAIDAVLKELDPHTAYIDKRYLQGIEEKMKGDFEGIGVEFMILEDTVVFLNVIEGGPAQAAGAQKGDQLIFVQDSMIAGKKYDNYDIVDMLKGPADTKVDVRVKRPGSENLVDLTIRRGQVNLPSIPCAFRIEDDVVYLRIERFSGKTYSEFLQALDKQREKGAFKHLVLDLRDNPGGYLHQAVDILSQFFEDKGQLLVYTEGLKSKKAEYKTTGKRLIDIENIAVIVNEASASASEIMAGAIQDLDRGVIVGRRTYGKGLVQDQYDLSDGSALRLTISRYYTPSGRLIQKDYSEGVAYDEDLNERIKSGELFHEDSILKDNSSAFLTLNGREVQAGNGIIPDIFIPMDSIYLNPCFQNVYTILEKFALDFYINSGKDFEDLNTLTRYVERNDALYSQLVDRIENESCDGIDAFLNRKDDMKQSIASFLAKYYFNKSAFYEVMMQGDPAVDEAVNIVQEKNPIFAINN